MNGSSTSLSAGYRPMAKPSTMPPSEPIRKPATVSCIVIHALNSNEPSSVIFTK
jgi:hypothetical protein